VSAILKEKATVKGVCDICKRECVNPSWVRIMSDDPLYCCKTCKVIWYDGATSTEEIRRHSLQWPVDHYGAYRKKSYDNEPEKPVAIEVCPTCGQKRQEVK